MSNDSSFHDAKRLYLEQYGDPMVTNTYLKIALVLLALVAVGLGLIDLTNDSHLPELPPACDSH